MTMKKAILAGLVGCSVVFTVASFAAFLYIRFVVGWFFVIPQNGMYPSYPAGSRIYGINRPYGDVSQVARGDVILFERGEGEDRHITICRVVGLPGETVETEGYGLRIDGKEATHKLVRREGAVQIDTESFGPATHQIAIDARLSRAIPDPVRVTVPRDQLFVMGDNRRTAVDSRIIGPIPFRSIIAKKW